jgi:predicted GIY-YIG superfamily endonuclease
MNLDGARVSWCKLEDLARRRFVDVPKSPGVYFVRWSRGGKPVAIYRLGGRDEGGILYVGSSEDLRRRVGQFWRAITRGAGQHTVFSTLAFCELSDLVKSSELEASWKALMSPEDAESQEWAAMYLYCRKYKEPPPLNLSVGRKKYVILGLTRLNEARLAPEIDDYVKSVVDP